MPVSISNILREYVKGIKNIFACSRSKFLSYFLIFFVKNFHITLFHFTEKRSYFFVVKQRFKE